MRIPEPQPDDPSRDSGERLDAFLEGTLPEAEDLHRQVNLLPPVDNEGNSECPFARELYAKKEQLEEQLTSTLTTLYQYDSDIHKEIQRCGNNVVVVSAGETRLNNDNAKRMFTEAEVSASAEYSRWVARGDYIAEVIRHVEHALAEARKKQFPGGAGPGWPSPPSSSGPTATPGDSDWPEIDHLLAMGPVGRKALKSAVREEVDETP